MAGACVLLAIASCSNAGDTEGEVTAPPAETATPAPPVPDSPGIGTEHPSSSSQSGDEPESEGGSSENPDPDPESDAPSQGGDGEGGSSDQPPKKGAYDPDDGVLQVWTLGDSITLGVQGGYRNDIYTLLTADGQNVDMVGTEYDDSTEIADKDHEGHVAFTIQQTIESVDGWLAQITPPDIVLLWLGANDFAWWTNMTPAQHADDFDQLVNHLLVILPAQSKIVIGTIPPESSEIVESVALDRADMADDFNEILRNRVPAYAAYGDRVFLADVRATLTLDDLYDGIHPTREAHARIAGVFHDVLSKSLGL